MPQNSCFVFQSHLREIHSKVNPVEHRMMETLSTGFPCNAKNTYPAILLVPFLGWWKHDPFFKGCWWPHFESPGMNIYNPVYRGKVYFVHVHTSPSWFFWFAAQILQVMAPYHDFFLLIDILWGNSPKLNECPKEPFQKEMSSSNHWFSRGYIDFRWSKLWEGHK